MKRLPQAVMFQQPAVLGEEKGATPPQQTTTTEKPYIVDKILKNKHFWNSAQLLFFPSSTSYFWNTSQ